VDDLTDVMKSRSVTADIYYRCCDESGRSNW